MCKYKVIILIKSKEKRLSVQWKKQQVFHIFSRYVIQVQTGFTLIHCIQTILDRIVSFNRQLSFESSDGLYDPDDREYRNTFRNTCVAPRESPAYGNTKPKKSPTKKRLYANGFSIAFTLVSDKDG